MTSTAQVRRQAVGEFVKQHCNQVNFSTMKVIQPEVPRMTRNTIRVTYVRVEPCPDFRVGRI